MPRKERHLGRDYEEETYDTREQDGLEMKTIEALNEEIEQYKVEIDVLKSQNQVLREKLAEKEERIDELDKSYNYQVKEIEVLKMENERLLNSNNILKDILTNAVGLL